MGLIRSAREIAAEKAERLGGLSAEEERCLREQELASAGTVLAERFLSSGDERVLGEQLGRYSAKERPAVVRALVGGLLQAVSLKSPGRFESVAQAIASLPECQALRSLLDRLGALFERYHQAEEEARGSIDREGKEALHRMRVGGTAVAGINIRARPEWEQRLHTILGPFAVELEEIKREIMAALEGGT
jgi:hypothetical protein